MTRLTDLLFCEVVTEEGKKLGRVFDLGCGKEIKRGGEQKPTVEELIYGTRGLLEALGFKRMRPKRVSWRMVKRIENKTIIVSDQS